MQEFDIVIVGGGPAGMAAAIAAREEGIEDILILEREEQLGGMLNQFIHNDFGLNTFKEELTGPEYAQRFIDKINELNIEYKLNTMVLELSKDKLVTAVNPEEGVLEVKAKSIILAMGSRERPRGAMNIPGSGCAGIYTAATAQRFVNIEGYMPGKEVVILGSGDIGLIMARRMTLEGAKVKAVVESMPYSRGSKRNIVQCLDDFNIPLKLNHTVIDIKGKERVEGVTIAEVDENAKPIKSREEFIECDTLLLSVELLPENEVCRKTKIKLSDMMGGIEVDESMQTDREGIFACGNVIYYYDLVDDVTKESYRAGKNAASYVKGVRFDGENIELIARDGISYITPKYIKAKNSYEYIDIRFGVDNVYKNACISVYFDDIKECSIKKRILAPGEREIFKISKAMLDKYKNCKQITFKAEEE